MRSGDKEFMGRAMGTNGKQTVIKPSAGSNFKGEITSISVVGKEERNLAEVARDKYMLHVLQGKRDLHDVDFPLIRHLWFPDNQSLDLVQKDISRARSVGHLNHSQSLVVAAMLSSKSPFIVVHGAFKLMVTGTTTCAHSMLAAGPPGTGKTSTISAAVQQRAESSKFTWVVAQSNVGVKNIAERLCKDGVAFRLIVSKDFYYEW